MIHRQARARGRAVSIREAPTLGSAEAFDAGSFLGFLVRGPGLYENERLSADVE